MIFGLFGPIDAILFLVLTSALVIDLIAMLRGKQDPKWVCIWAGFWSLFWVLEFIAAPSHHTFSEMTITALGWVITSIATIWIALWLILHWHDLAPRIVRAGKAIISRLRRINP